MPSFWIVDTRREYDWVFNIYVPIGLGVFALFTLVILFMALRYRRRADSPDGPLTRGARKNENNLVEGSYALVLVLVAAFLLYVTYTAEHKIDTVSARERPAATVDVTASRWEWKFQYPGHGITHISGEVGNQPLVVPAGVPVRIALRSADVIHSFWIPQLAFKRDAMPGTIEHVTLDFDKTGHFSGSCSEYCGVGHSEMTFDVDVLSDSRFHAWLASGGKTAT